MIIFYFPQKQIGGVVLLFFNIIKILKERKKECGAILYKNSSIYEMLSINKINIPLLFLDSINKVNSRNFIKHDDIVIFTTFDKNILYFKSSNPKFFFWLVYYNTIENFNQLIVTFPKKIKKMLEYMISNNSLAVMDINCMDNLKKYVNIDNIPYLPIPVEFKNNIFINNFRLDSFNKSMNISYIGRAVKWKIYPFKKIISDINKIENNLTINIFVYTDNSKKFSEHIKNNSKKIVIKYFEGFDNNQIIEHALKNNVLINIAMGTSALETGKIGIPTILIDGSFSNIKEDYKYRWLYESKHFDLGQIIDQNNTSNGSFYLTELFDKISKEFLINNSKKTYEYVTAKHNLYDIVNKFLYLCENSNARISAIVKYLYIRIIKNIIKY